MGPMRRFALLATGMLVLVSACAFQGSEESQLDPPVVLATKTTKAVAPTPSSKKTKPTPSRQVETPALQQQSVFRSILPRPDGVVETIFRSAPGPPYCPKPYGPGDTVESFSVEVLDADGVCLDGFDESRASLSVTGAETSANPMTMSFFDGFLYLDVYPSLDTPRGRYVFSVDQDGVEELTGSFDVVDATVPRITSLQDSGPAGTTFRIALVGYRTRVQPYLYMYAEGVWNFRTVLSAVDTDPAGVTILELHSEPGDPAGTYGVLTDPEAQCVDASKVDCASFTIHP